MSRAPVLSCDRHDDSAAGLHGRCEHCDSCRQRDQGSRGAIRRQAWRELIGLSDQIWAYAETALEEHQSADALADYAEQQGFKVERGVAGMPTAFVATLRRGPADHRRHGRVRRAARHLAEGAAEKTPLVEAGAGGHGCGHNMFGAASLGAASRSRSRSRPASCKGTIRFYGTPAEEAVGGKIYMVRDGLFNDLDVVLAWHPGDDTQADTTSSQAMVDFVVEFRGKAAHAASIPGTAAAPSMRWSSSRTAST